MFLQVLAFAESYVAVFSIEFESVLFERDCGSRVIVTSFTIPWWVIVWIVAGVPTIERFSELLENSLTGLRVQIPVAFMLFEVRCEFVVIWDMACGLPDALDVPAADVPEFGGGERERMRLARTCDWLRVLALKVRVTTRFAIPESCTVTIVKSWISQ